MSSVFASLGASAQSLTAFSRAIEVTNNNVTNASTPGYAAQSVDFTALSFSLDSGLAGGVASSSSSTRNLYLDESVRYQLTHLGTAQQSTESLSGIESVFDVSGTTGVPGALTQLFSSFSALSISPASNSARQAVVTAAQQTAAAFQQTAAALVQASTSSENQVHTQLGQINALATEIQSYNSEQERSGLPDAGREAKLNAALEKLSSLANIATRTNANGGTDVLLNGQIPLVLGSQQYALHAALAPNPSQPATYPGGTPSLQVLDSSGRDITAQIQAGSLAGLLAFRNTTLPGLRGDREQPGSLNLLATAFADRVNSLLTSGLVTEGPPPQSGVPLFTYDPGDATKGASSLAVTPGFSPAQIAVIDPGPPEVSNGIAIKLANLAQGTDAADQIDGYSYAAYFGQIAGAVGQELATQKNAADVRRQSLDQAQSFRAQVSGVSLDAEAVKLLAYQKSYSASAKLITVLDQITQSTLDILR